MQPRLVVTIPVLQSEGLVSSSRYVGFTLQFAPAGVVVEPNQIVFFIGHLSWDAERVVGVAAVKYGTKKIV